MPSSRRTFLTSSMATAAALAATTRPARAAAAATAAGREYYEIRCYHLKADTRLKASAPRAPVEAYLGEALLPALARRNVGPVGVFTEIKVDKPKGTSEPVADSPLWVLIPHATLESFHAVSADLVTDPQLQAAGAAYLQVEKAKPAFERVDTWLLRAFASMPRLEVPAFSKAKAPGRVFEMRDYESHSELKALNKMAMFDEGETQLMRDLGMSPVFFGQALAGPNLPHLRYFTSGPTLEAHLAGWKKFGPDPRWMKMKDDPRWANNTSRNTARFLVPAACSQL